MFDFLYIPIGWLLSFFNSFTGHYAIALLLYALFFKLILIPFGIKQQKNMISMAKLRPKIALIEKKYAGRNDQITLQKKQEEIMKLQQDEGYSPLSGCLPMLIQLPIIMLLYGVINAPLQYICQWNLADGQTVQEAIVALANALGMTNGGNAFTVETFSAIKQIELVSLISQNTNLAATYGLVIESVPNFNLFGTSLAQTPDLANFSWLCIIPPLVAGIQYVSMVITRKFSGNIQTAGQAEADKQTQASMKMMDITMPLLTLWMAFSFSAMLGIYWIYQSILGVIQSIVLAKVMPMPTFTDAELKEMEKAAKANERAQKAALKSQPKYRSLHYIDEDDYDELPEIKKDNGKKNGGSNFGIEAPDLKK